MKKLLQTLGFAMALLATNAYAIPTLNFFGDVSYSQANGNLNVTGTLNGSSSDLALTTTGSSILFDASFDSATQLSSGGLFGTTSTKGLFTGNPDAGVSDLLIYDGDAGNTLLLAAKFDSLTLEGVNGGDSGELVGILNATGGSFLNALNGSSLIAFTLNLNTTFSNTMFNSDFAGNVNGDITGVPEPSLLAMLGLGVLVVGFSRKKAASL